MVLSHPFAGDLAVASGVLDAEGNVLCEVPLATPDQNNAEPGLAVEASLEDCADFYPPTPDQPWYVYAADTLAADVGTCSRGHGRTRPRGHRRRHRGIHTFVGDLEVIAGVADADGNVVCEVPVAAPDPQNGEQDLSGAFSMGACLDFYPPQSDRVWFLNAVDTVAVDEGSIVAFDLVGPDGRVLIGSVPVPIPDADPEGAAVLITG